MFQNYSAESISFKIFILGRARERGFLFFSIESVSLIIMPSSLKKPPEEYFSIYSFYLLFSTFYIIFLRLSSPQLFFSQQYNQNEITLRTHFSFAPNTLHCPAPVLISPTQIPKEKWWREKNKEGFGMPAFLPLGVEHTICSYGRSRKDGFKVLRPLLTATSAQKFEQFTLIHWNLLELGLNLSLSPSFPFSSPFLSPPAASFSPSSYFFK